MTGSLIAAGDARSQHSPAGGGHALLSKQSIDEAMRAKREAARARRCGAALPRYSTNTRDMGDRTMAWRRWVSFGLVALAMSLPARPSSAQLATANGQDGGSPVAGGFAGLSNSGGYSAAVPLDLPPARGGLPIPVQITYSESGTGAVGLGWEVPLSFIRRDVTFAHRRPVGTPNVAPQAREQVSLVLDGRSMDLVRSATAWVARRDAPDITARENADGTWVVFDGVGRSYRFAAVAPALVGTNLWLLQDVSGPGGSNVHLDYTIATPTVPGGTGLSIDLASVRYNPSPTTIGCYKNAVNLTYDANGSPLSMSLLGSTPLVRLHKLVTVDVTGRETCTSSPVRLRQYQLAYAPDPDTRQPRLQTVQVFGRTGTPEAATAIPVATYTYGIASNGGSLIYGLTNPMGVAYLGQTKSSTPILGGMGAGFSTDQMLVDVTGDGQPDVVTFANNSLSVRRNIYSLSEAGLAPSTQLSDATLSPRPIETRTAEVPDRNSTTPAYSRLWRQAIDVNGDGRVDVIDAAEQPGHWVIYLNAPDPADPTHVQWLRRSVSISTLAQHLANRGISNNSQHLPLARQAISGEGLVATCWQFIPNGSRPIDGGRWVRAEGPIGCTPALPPLLNKTITEWELKDVNGDGYPDVVFNSSRATVRVQIESDDRDPIGPAGAFAAVVESRALVLQSGTTNKIDAVLGILGTRLTDGNDEPFSAPVTLRSGDACGVSQSVPDGPDAEHVQCDVTDTNGDGIVDRVIGSSVWLGTGALAGSQFFMPGSMLTLPGQLAVTTSNQGTICHAAGASGGTTFTTQTTAQLIDVTGDGIPDYVSRNGAGSWSVSIGTGLGFAAAMPVTAGSGSPDAFSLNVASASCDGTRLTRKAGLFDINGDGKPDVVSEAGDVRELVGTGYLASHAGRLVGIDNGFGARTDIRYRSIKYSLLGVHQVPFPEIVVESVTTTGTRGLGGDVSTIRYAYSGSELVFDAAHDAFIFPGYRRRIQVQDPVTPPVGVGTITITDIYAPVSAVNPYGLASDSTMTAAQRYALSRRNGRVRDVTVLAGTFESHPWVPVLDEPSWLLGIDVTRDARRVAGVHYEWDARLLASPSDPAGPEPCSELLFPYDSAASTAFDASHDHVDACTARGFAFVSSVQSWRGEPGAAPPSTRNVETRSEVIDIDDFGRILSVRDSNDVHRSDDDLCVATVYAAHSGSNERVLSAAASRTVSDCTTAAIYAKDRWEYDQLANGVSAGFLTSHTVERRSDGGSFLETIREFDASYDAAGNLATVTTTREDGATRAVAIAYDAFGLALVSMTTTATGVPTTQVSITRDPITLNATATTDPHGTRHGTTFDGFDREILSTFTPPGGAEGALSITSYLGFGGGDPLGRRVVTKVFADPVAPNSAMTATGRTSRVFLDELGRERHAELVLGADYPDQTLIVGQRTYDRRGRVVFEADPRPSTQAFETAYGTTAFFNPDGTPSCTVRGNGQQPIAPAATNEAEELYPTCIERVFENNTEVVSVRDASSYLTNSPQFGVKKKGYVTAAGRVITRSTWQGQSRLEHATFAYDRLGHLTGMTRYQDAAGATKPVTSSWRHDSLGQVLQLDEPDSVPQFRSYSRWGDLLDVARYPETPPNPTDGNPPPPPPGDPGLAGLHVVQTYDALGRVVHSEQRREGVIDPETVHDYFYDQGVQVAPQVVPTHVLGRLARTISPTGSVSFSYDSLGRIDARVFTDNQGSLYVEKHTFHADGAPLALDLFLPDTAYADEHIEYRYDSAGRGRSVTYANGSDTHDLYEASTIDPFGRVREARYGQTSFTASYADVGRRLINQVTIASMAGSRAITFQGFDPMERERSRLETKTGASGTTTTTTSHVYDALGRLSSSSKTAGTTAVFDQQFTYDPLGNILHLSNSVGGGAAANTTLSYLATDRDRICRIAYGTDAGTACNVTYDEVGNITSQATATGTREYSYLIDGSVRTISDNHGTAAHYRYDAFGGVQELELTSSLPPFSDDARHDRHYGELLTWRIANESTLLRKIPGPDGFLATRRGAAGPWIFQFGESHGNRFFTDETGAFVQDVDYQPYGTANSTGAAPGGRLYTTEQWNFGDALTAFGISRLGARLYDPSIGRFLSRDPLFIPRTAATTNPYAFASNDPVNRSDPSGLNDMRHLKWVNESGEHDPGGREVIQPRPPIAHPVLPPPLPPIPPAPPPPGPATPPPVPDPSLPTDPSQGYESGPGGSHEPGSGTAGGSTAPPVNDAQARALLGQRFVDPRQRVARIFNAAGDRFKQAAGTFSDTGLDLLPVVGSIRHCLRGDMQGCAVSIASDLLIAGKAFKIVSAAGKLGRVASGAHSAVPLLTRGPGGQMLGEALNILKGTPAAQRAALASDLLGQVEARAIGGAWRATEMGAAGGAVAWVGETHTLVIDAVGRVFTGPHVGGAVQFGVVDGRIGIVAWSGLRLLF